MTVKEAIYKRRTIRNFTQEPVPREALADIIDCGRVAAFGGNMQPLKFAVIDDRRTCEELFPLIKWAAYLSDGAPREGERPLSYIAILGDKSIKNGNFETDAGAAVTNMMLAAEEAGLATCWLGAIQRPQIKELLRLEDKYDVLYLLAVGYPAQKSVMCSFDGSVKYFIDENGTVNVPKRSLEEVIVSVKGTEK